MSKKKKKTVVALKNNIMNNKIARIKFKTLFNVIIYFTHEKIKSLFIKLFNLGMGFLNSTPHINSSILTILLFFFFFGG